MLAALALAAPSANAINHPPFISWIPDQRIMSGGFATQYFRIFDYDQLGFSITKQSTNGTWYPATNVTISACTPQDTGCAQDGTGYKAVFVNPTSDGVTTIIIGASQTGTNLTGYTSFTLRRASTDGNNPPPSIGSLPNYAIQLPSSTGQAVYQTSFVIGDLDANGNEDIANMSPSSFTWSSTNTQILSSSSITFAYANVGDPRSYVLTATTNAGAIGVATVTINLTDPNFAVTSTSFVLQVVAATDHPPSITNTNLKSFEEQISTGYTDHSFTVADSDVTSDQLKVSAFSSNTNLVPNDFQNNLVVTQPNSSGAGSVRITPVLPLPSPGVPQASTITLSVTDDAYARQTTFLYVMRATSLVASFSRPAGVYALRPPGVLTLQTNPFLNGTAYSAQWDQLEPTQGNFVWDSLDSQIDTLPSGQDLELDLEKEPCYIAQTPGVVTWCDIKPGNQPHHCPTPTPTPCPSGGFPRAVPWDGYLLQRRATFIQALAAHLNTTGRIGKISIINTNLPGADTGIENVSVPFDGMSGYTRPALLGAIQHELRTMQDNFPGKLLQIGFFPATDSQNPTYLDELWQWLYRDASSSVDANGVHLLSLFDEFNGVVRPRVSFFQDNLAAARTSNPPASPTPTPTPSSNAPNYVTPGATTAYTFTPLASFLPSFAYYVGGPTADAYNNGITFQANTIWADPFTQVTGDPKLIKTINGSPNDGMEGAFNGYLSQYLEVYQYDINHAAPGFGVPPTLDAVLWAGELQSWHDYNAYKRSQAPIEGPAGLTVARASATSNTVSWYSVYGATSYTLQRQLLGINNSWTTVSCSDPTATNCLDTGSTGSAYAYRVQATNGTNNSLWSYVAVFLSESAYDGYVTRQTGFPNVPNNNAPQPGILAGEQNVNPLVHERGFVSFQTNLLTSSATILDAQLRLNQATSGSNFALLGPCMVDVKQGSFNNSPVLEPQDYSATATTVNAFPVTNVNQNNWFTAELPLSTAKLNISTTDHTQFRIYFAEGTVAGRYEGWYSGESSGNNSQPQLIVRYTLP